jgi:cobalt-zinc-cadmium efflux system membrane fusion protein
MTLGPATIGLNVAARLPFPEVRLSSPNVARKVGLHTGQSEARRASPNLRGNAEIAYNANLYAEVRPRVSGIIREVLVDEGSPVQPAEPMIIIDSAEVGSAKATFLAALPAAKLAEQTLEMTMRLRSTNSAPLKEELSARALQNKTRADVLNARQHLLNLGYSEADLEEITNNQDTSNLHRVVAPIQGTVVERHAVPGEAVEPNHKLFGVADTRIMWTWIDVYEDQIDEVEIGQPVRLTISGTVTPVFSGRVDWIDTAVNPATRTIRIRAEMMNPTGRLRTFEFGRAVILTGSERETVVVPRDAVQDVEGTEVVFLPLGEGRFEPRPVVTRASEEPGYLEIVAGLGPGREVVITGAFLLKSELVKQMSAPEGGP